MNASTPTPRPIDASLRREPRPTDPLRPNIVAILMDDAGRLQFGSYDRENSWPEGYPYPDTPWLDSKIAEGIRFTRCYASPRCSPDRACRMSGRYAHVSPGHPYGTRIGEIQSTAYQPAEAPFLGLLAEHRALPGVAKAANSGYSHYLGGKWHLYQFDLIGNGYTIANRESVTDVHGWDRFEETLLSGSGPPDQGYWGYPWHTMTPGNIVNGTEPSSANGGRFQETYHYEKTTAWLDTLLTADPKAKFNIHWWSNLPHALFPAWDGTGQAPGGADYVLSFTEEQMVPDAVSPYGATDLAGFKRDENGIIWQNSPFHPEECIYGGQGRCNVIGRRAFCIVEAWDQAMQFFDDWLRSNHPEAYANTLWMIGSDNGIATSDSTPMKDPRFAAMAPKLGPVYPPTIESYGDGTGSVSYTTALEIGQRYHFWEDAKGSGADEGTRVPLVVSGPMLPSRVKGTENAALIESVDHYATVLDLIAGPVAPSDTSGRTHWRDAIGSDDLAKVDGISFLPCLLDLSDGDRDYGFTQVFGSSIAGTETWIQRGLTNRGNWKLRIDFDAVTSTDKRELFNLVDDPREQNDLYASTEVDAIDNKQDLEAELARILA